MLPWSPPRTGCAPRFARRRGPEPTEHERQVVEALSTTFGNCGWFDGSLGDVVRAAVGYLGVPEED
jgi:hypothetical protein